MTWEKKRLRDVLTVIRGVSYKKEQAKNEAFAGYVPILRATNIQDRLTFDELVYVPRSNVSPEQQLRKGDIVVAASSGSRAVVGKAAQLNEDWNGSFGAFCFGLRPAPAVDARFIGWFLQTREYRNRVSELAAGVNINNLRARHIEETPIRLPSLYEQQRIAAEIEKQFTRLDAGVVSLKSTKARLQAYRDSFLNAVFDQPWSQLPISDVAEVVTGSTPPTKDRENFGDAVPFIKPTDLNSGYRVQEAREHLSLKGARLSTILPAWTVLVTCIGATIGKTGLARIRCATNQQINALVPNDSVATAKWLFWVLVSPKGQELIKRNASATTLPIINKRRFASLLVPVPPLAVQKSITAEIEEIASVVDTTDRTVAANLTRANKVRQAVLDRAFAGQL